MKTRAAVLREVPGNWEVCTADLDAPREHEVLVRMVAAGLCHSDQHYATGDNPPEHLPFCGGHEGAGIVEEVGPGVTSLKAGDHVVTSFIPSCGRCRWCLSGDAALCDNGAGISIGKQLDGTFRMHLDGEPVGQSALVSTFSEYSVMPEVSAIRIADDIPLAIAALVSCGVPTGWGSAVNVAKVGPGDVVIVIGVGGIGINAVQGARHAGASRVIAVDPVQLKRDFALQLGATDAFAGHEEATDLARSLTNGQGADAAIVCVGVTHGEHVAAAFSAIRKAGTVVLTGVAPGAEIGIPVGLAEMVYYKKRIQGTLYGSVAPASGIPQLLRFWQDGALRLDELVTRTYSLDDINIGYEDLLAGRNMRGVIKFD